MLQGGAEAAEELTEAQLTTLKFNEMEQQATDGRLAGDSGQLRRLRPVRRPPSVLPEDPLWDEYLAYHDARVAEIAAHEKGLRATRPKNPLAWKKYEVIQRSTRRGIEFQEEVKQAILAEQTLDPKLRLFTGKIRRMHLDSNMGVQKGSETTKYVDVSIIDMDAIGPGKTPEVVQVSAKSPDCWGMSVEDAAAMARRDFNELVDKYGGRVEIRRPGHPLFGQEVEVTRLHLVYDAKYIGQPLGTPLPGYAPHLDAGTSNRSLWNLGGVWC